MGAVGVSGRAASPDDPAAASATDEEVAAGGVSTDTVVEAATAGRALRIGGRSYPVFLPKLRDSRLHVASVVLTIHVLGQVGLGFHVSVPQILAAILTCFVISVVATFWTTRTLVWPASAMLTGSGVALILRVPSTEQGNHWTFHAWWLFAGIAAFSLGTKYVFRYRGAPLFNPSNVGLVIAFLVLGSTRAEPLDFWWAPLSAWMVLAYAVILVGGILITRRLKLLAAGATFWLTLAAGVGVLAATGHCITARWAFAPVCGIDFWRVIIVSPEVLIFLFFMLTDPKTVPAGRVGRVLFGFSVAALAVLLMAPQTTEFGTKVALLAALVIMCACRPLIERIVPVPGTPDDSLGAYARRLVTGGDGGVGLAGRVARVGAMCVLPAAIAVGIVVASTSPNAVIAADDQELLGRTLDDIDPSTLPTVTVEQGVIDWNHEISGDGAKEIVLAVVENLMLENQALKRHDPALLELVDHGDRLDDMRERITAAESSGLTTITSYEIDDVNVTLLVPFGRQDGLSLGLESTGTATTTTYDSDGDQVDESTEPFETMFVTRRATGDRWLNVDELPTED